jgi:hypothetical protein
MSDELKECREVFEKDFPHADLRRCPIVAGSYYTAGTEDMWVAFQAAWNRRAPAQVAAGLSGLPDVVKFLLGEGELDGAWYGDPRPVGAPPFWWRKPLREVFARAIEAKVQAAAPVAKQWQPIETAPKDEFVWLYEEGRGVWIGRFDYVGDGCLWGNSYGSVYLRKDQWLGDNEIDDDYKPTRWMPLPAPPSDSLGGEG